MFDTFCERRNKACRLQVGPLQPGSWPLFGWNRKQSLTNATSVIPIICVRATPWLGPLDALLLHTTQRWRSWASTRVSKAILLEVYETSCSYSKPAGRLLNSWSCRGRIGKGTWSGMNVSSIEKNMVYILDAGESKVRIFSRRLKLQWSK